ncbi:MAG: tryptophan--tRNA ligase [Thermoplasmata archaeon]|nr:tryptophan--tRNA ligase [Thermoplasmata archaeon]
MTGPSVPAKDDFTVTPYEVKGRIDYARLRELFGTEDLTPALLDRLKAAAGRPLPPSLERGIYYSHRDLGRILDAHAGGRPFFLYSGRGPSGPVHTSHLLAFELSKWFQESFGAEMWIQITDDEKVWAKGDLSRAESYRWGLDNLADLLAVGFAPEKTHVFFDTRSIGAMYPLAVDVARKIPYSTVKAVFGFPPSTNVGLVFYTALQSVPCFYPSWVAGRDIPCLIPCGIDQDPHFRVTRDLAERLGFPKPALLHSQMTPGLLGPDRVMSTTGDQRDNALFLSDPPKEVERKLKKAFTGGRATVEEQRRLGATPEICSVWALWRSRYAPEAPEFDTITGDCRSGKLLCGDCKSMLIERVNGSFAAHAERKAKAREWAESRIVEALPDGFDPHAVVPSRGGETPPSPSPVG